MAEQKTVEELLKGSFLRFLFYVWTRVLTLPRPTRIQNDIGRYLEDGPRLRFIAAFRGVGKTFLTGAYIVWRLWRDPDLKIVVVSANERFAATISTFIYNLIQATDALTGEDVPWAELRPRPGQRDSTLLFDVGPARLSKDPSVLALGINGQLSGSRADILLFDDVEVPNNSMTESQRETLEFKIGEAAALRKPGAETIYLGTFQSMASVYKGLKAKGYSVRLWPSRYPLATKEELYLDVLAPTLAKDMAEHPELRERKYGSSLGGAPTDPKRFDVADLMERETEWGVASFQLQFMLDTSLTDQERFPLKTRDLIVMDVPPDIAPVSLAWGSAPKQMIRDLDNVGFDGDRFYAPMYISDDFKPFTGSLMEIDPSGSGTDETGYVVTKFLNGYVYVTRWGGFKDGHSEETLEALAKIAVEEKVNLIREESNFGDGMFGRLLETHLRRQGYKGGVEEHKVHKGMGSKEHRIVNTVRPALESHRVVFDTNVVKKDLLEVNRAGSGEKQRIAALEYSGLYQLTHMANQRGALRKDDRIDVLAGALSYWAEHMALDSIVAEAKEKRKQDEEFARLVMATQIKGSKFYPDPVTRTRGAGRKVSRGRR